MSTGIGTARRSCRAIRTCNGRSRCYWRTIFLCGAEAVAWTILLGWLYHVTWVGLLLLGITLVTPLLVGVRARSSALVPSLSGAVAAFLLHAGTDWDLLVPGLTVPFLLCCAALLVSRADAPRVVLASPKRLLLVAAAGLLALVAGIGLMGNQQLLDSYSAENHGDFRGSLAAMVVPAMDPDGKREMGAR